MGPALHKEQVKLGQGEAVGLSKDVQLELMGRRTNWEEFYRIMFETEKNRKHKIEQRCAGCARGVEARGVCPVWPRSQRRKSGWRVRSGRGHLGTSVS